MHIFIMSLIYVQCFEKIQRKLKELISQSMYYLPTWNTNSLFQKLQTEA